MSTPVLVESSTQRKSGPVSVRPYVDQTKQNMGLEKYGLALFDGVAHEEQLACIEMNGQKRYVTGLNEFAPDVKLLPEELRAPKAKEIRRVVAELEKELAANILDPDDKEFWNKVKLLKPDNDEFWGKISIRCSNSPLFLDITKPYDLIKIYAIEAGGFSIVSKSYESARSMSVAPKFYLDRYEDTISTTTELKKLRNRAAAELQKLYEKNINKLIYVAKVIDVSSVQYKKSTPHDVLYDNMDKFINGEGSEKSKKRAAQMFLDAVGSDIENLKLRALVKDATWYKFIQTKSDGFIYHVDSGAMLGRTPSDCVEYLKNPLNDQILGKLLSPVEKLWNQ